MEDLIKPEKYYEAAHFLCEYMLNLDADKLKEYQSISNEADKRTLLIGDLIGLFRFVSQREINTPTELGKYTANKVNSRLWSQEEFYEILKRGSEI